MFRKVLYSLRTEWHNMRHWYYLVLGVLAERVEGESAREARRRYCRTRHAYVTEGAAGAGG